MPRQASTKPPATRHDIAMQQLGLIHLAKERRDQKAEKMRRWRAGKEAAKCSTS
jgi:hypothetical protein